MLGVMLQDVLAMGDGLIVAAILDHVLDLGNILLQANVWHRYLLPLPTARLAPGTAQRQRLTPS